VAQLALGVITRASMRAYSLYILVCVLGFSAITLRVASLHYAQLCASTAARAVTLTGAERLQTRGAARSAARVSDRMSLISLAAVLVGGVLWFIARRRQRAESVLPALLLLVYVFLSLVMV